MSELHDVKCWPTYFGPILQRKKTFELRLNDRNYKEGDYVRLREYSYSPDQESGKRWDYTGRELMLLITYVLQNDQESAVPEGLNPRYCIFSFEIVE